MPLLDIATAQPSLSNYLFSRRFQTVYHGTFSIGGDTTTFGRYFRVPNKAKNLRRTERRCGGLIVKAVATVEPRCSIRRNGNLHLAFDSATSPPLAETQSSTEDSADLDQKEQLRRKRISKANSGKRPWNKGRQHSAETRQRIRERTRLAMQDPKVKMKLVKLGHAQSAETRIKIGKGVRMRWQRRYKKRILQETICYEWENLIAEASRMGFNGEEELQWNSYEILDEELEQEWVESVEQRKNVRAPNSSKRAPKSLEQRRKISEAIHAKWADPAYRDRVSSGMSRYHGSSAGVQKEKRSVTIDKQPKRTTPTKKDYAALNVIKSQKQWPKMGRRKGPEYKDPLASSKLEMLKAIRAQRAAAQSTKSEAVRRAKLLIGEAEKAAEALEVAAAVSPLAQASLIETRKLIAEAIESIGSIDPAYLHSHVIRESSPSTSMGPVNYVEEEPECELEGPTQTGHQVVNGFRTLESRDADFMDLGFGKINLQDLLDTDDEDNDDDLETRSTDFDLVKLELDYMINHDYLTKQEGNAEPNGSNQVESMHPSPVNPEQVGNLKPNGRDQHESLLHRQERAPSEEEERQPSRPPKIKKWVRGKLVEVGEETS